MNENPEALALPARKLYIATQQQKAQWVKRFNESGLSLREFSDQNGIGYMSLWRWVSRTKAKPSTEPAAEPHQAAFTEIKLVPSVERSDWVAELSLSNGRILRLSKEVPAAMLEQLLRLC